MEEILSSIKRIIAEDDDSSAAKSSGGSDTLVSRRESDRASHRKAVVAGMAGSVDDSSSYVDEVLELTDEMPNVGKAAADQPKSAPKADIQEKKTRPAAQEKEQRATVAESDDAVAEAESKDASNMMVSVESEIAARSSLAALSSMVMKPEEGSDNTLEGMVREMLRPMLKEWLDENLPTLVEGMVSKEIARITGRSL